MARWQRYTAPETKQAYLYDEASGQSKWADGSAEVWTANPRRANVAREIMRRRRRSKDAAFAAAAAPVRASDATPRGGRPKGGKDADDAVPESLAYLPARLPTDRYFDAASRLEDPTSPYYWTGQLSSPAARVFLPPTILHVGRRHALRRTTINARSRIY